MNVLQLEVEEKNEEEEVGNREQTSTQRVMKIETVIHHHHFQQNKKAKFITSTYHSIQRYSRRRNSVSRQSYRIHKSLFSRKYDVRRDSSKGQRSIYHHNQSKTSQQIFLPQVPSYEISFKYTKPITDCT